MCAALSRNILLLCVDLRYFRYNYFLLTKSNIEILLCKDEASLVRSCTISRCVCTS